ncbi:MAG: TatD family hydrolase [Hyphomicrobiales bacterium]
MTTLSSNKFIDIHTHSTGEGDVEIINIMPGDSSSGIFYSIGIHPSYIDKYQSHGFDILKEEINKKNCLAVGESGIDLFRKEVSLSVQKDVFIRHIELSELYKKPLVIHAVRSYNHIIELKKLIRPSMKWIIHGFYGGDQVLSSLLNHGIYISFGPNIFHRSQKFTSSIKLMPLNQLFFETDEYNIEISDVYKEFASIKRIELNKLIVSVRNNFSEVFKF